MPKLYETGPETSRKYSYSNSILGAASLDISKEVNPWFLIVERPKRQKFEIKCSHRGYLKSGSTTEFIFKCVS